MAALKKDHRKLLEQLSQEVVRYISCNQVVKNDLQLSKITPKFVPDMHFDCENQVKHRVTLSARKPRLCFYWKVLFENHHQVMRREQHVSDWGTLVSCKWVQHGQWRIRPIKVLQLAFPKKPWYFFMIFLEWLLEFVPRNVTINADYHKGVLKHLKDRIQHKRPGISSCIKSTPHLMSRQKPSQEPPHPPTGWGAPIRKLPRMDDVMAMGLATDWFSSWLKIPAGANQLSCLPPKTLGFNLHQQGVIAQSPRWLKNGVT